MHWMLHTMRAPAAIALFTVAFSTLALGQHDPLPIMTKPFMYYGYYQADGHYGAGDYIDTVAKYTNTFVADACAYESSTHPNMTAFNLAIQKAVDKGMYIYLRIYRSELGQTQFMTDLQYYNVVLGSTVLRQHWAQVRFIELIEEPAWGTPRAEIESKISVLEGALASNGLADKPIGGVYLESSLIQNGVTTDTINAANLDFIALEIQRDASHQDEPLGSNAAYLKAFIDDAKVRIPAAKDLLFVIQGYKKIFWENKLTLAEVQRPAYVKAFNDPRVKGLLIWAYGRADGTVQPDMVDIKAQHVRIQEAMRPQDYDADLKPDLIFQNRATGDLTAWLMNGSTRKTPAPTPLSPGSVADTRWQIVGSGDFNGDGKPDLVWQHLGAGSTNNVAVWFMNGLQQTSGTLISAQAPDPWRVRAVGDANNDGRPDLFWHHAVDGRVALWRMNGLQQLNGVDVGQPAADLNWQIVGSGDLDRDGYLDLLWQHNANGELAWWRLKDNVRLSADLLGYQVVDLNWKVRGAGDIDRDGNVDLIWQHMVSTQLSVWFMNGLTLREGASTNPSSTGSTDVQIVAPR
jgi:hypothetical protein